MTDETLSPNELADHYDALFAVLENLPEETHPAWELAVESVVFGGEGIAPDATNYGEQQAERNEFKISEYREQYGDGDRVTRFPTLAMGSPREEDQQYVEDDVRLPVAPNSKEVLPLSVGDDDLAEAISLLNEFPPEPKADSPGEGSSVLLDERKFPSISPTDQQEPTDAESGRCEGTQDEGVKPNELADLYEGLRLVFNNLPEDVHPIWAEAIETMIFGGETLSAGAAPYGEQQAERNSFGMPEYRAKYGNGTRVTAFPTLTTEPPAEQQRQFVDEDIQVPVTPESGVPLPLNPGEEELAEALSLLSEFPAEPRADVPGEGISCLIDVGQLLHEVDTDPLRQSATTANDRHSSSNNERTRHSPGATKAETEPSSSGDGIETETESSQTQNQVNPKSESVQGEGHSGPTVLRQDGPGEGILSQQGNKSRATDSERKYDDPRAERAHRRAQQRDPSDVVEIGETITLVLKEVDYSSHPPTIMGTKNRLVIFVTEAPQHLSQYDTIRAKVVDYGGNNNSAEAVFLGFTD